MKKFFSLVLALVMALSLTTVAWGITDKNTLPDPVGGVIELTTDLTVTFAGERVPALADGTVINGNGHTLTLNGNIGSYNTYAAISGKNLTVNNLKVVNNLTAGYVFVLEGGSLNDVDVTGAGSVVMPKGTAAITLTDCDFKGFTNYAIMTDGSADAPFNLVDCTFEGSTYAIIVRNDDGSAVGCTFNAKVNLYAEDSAAGFTGNTFNERVKLYNDDEVLTGNSFGTNGVIALDTGVTSVDASGNYWGGGAPTAAQLGGATATTYITTTGGLSGTASTPASGAKGAYFTANLSDLSVHPNCDLSTFNYSLEAYTAAADTAKIFATVAIWQTHKITGAKTIVDTAVVASADSANLAFVNGASVTYLNTNVSTWTATATPVATVDVEDAEKCGDVFIAGDVGVYKDAADKVFYEDIGGVAYNVGGQLVLLKEAAKDYPVVDSAALKAALATPAAGTVYTVAHDYDCDYTTFNGKKTVTKVYCAECDAQFAFVAGKVSDAIAKFGAGNYLPTALVDAAGTVYVSIVPAGGTVVVPSTDKTVQSADTFDAGIAMYVGMSVLAATGSAVVIGKKKD